MQRAYTLTNADFQRHPVWQFKTDAESDGVADESCVAPAPGSLQLGAFGSFMVHATYGLKNGAELAGAVQVDLLGAKVLFTPVVMYVHGKQIDPLAPDVEARLARITKAAATRPERWRLNVPFSGEPAVRSGRIARSTFAQALGLFARLVLLRFHRRHQ